MSREEWEIFKDMKRHRQERSFERRRSFPEFVAALNVPGLQVIQFTDTHYRFKCAETVIDYWPGTQKAKINGRYVHLMTPNALKKKLISASRGEAA